MGTRNTDVDRKILVSVDFGTTFSGLAWTQTTKPDVKDIINQWPNTSAGFDGKFLDKVPTEIAYDDAGRIRWGFQITENASRYQWFKLGLNSAPNPGSSELKSAYPDSRSLPLNDKHNAASLSTDYLGCLREHALQVLEAKLGKYAIDTTPVQFIVSVPAIWDDAAKDRTAMCARKAGMGEDVRVISEPEAALVYALDALPSLDLEVGDVFMVCDAGGGTVDLITYEVAALHPRLKVREAVPGSGDACGSIFLNRIFSKYMDDMFEHEPEYDIEVKQQAMDAFERKKQEFTGRESSMVVPVPGLDKDLALAIDRGVMTIPVDKLKSEVFEPVFTKTLQLIKGQIRQAKRAPKSILLVGGLGCNGYLRTYLKQRLGLHINILQSPCAWTAVFRGALIWGLAEAVPGDSRICIATRKARKSYGTDVSREYSPASHDAGRKYFDGYAGADYVAVMDWFLKKGDDVDPDVPLVLNYSIQRRVSSGFFRLRKDRVCVFRPSEVGQNHPKYPSESRVLVDIVADLSVIPPEEVPTLPGIDRQMYYVLDFEIRVRFFSAHTEYSLWHNGKEYGKVNAEYA